MKTYLELLKNDYDYLNDIRDNIERNLDNYKEPISFNPNLLSIIDEYDTNELEYYAITINSLIERINRTNEKYLIIDLQDNRCSMLNCISNCLLMLASDLDKMRYMMDKENTNG